MGYKGGTGRPAVPAPCKKITARVQPTRSKAKAKASAGDVTMSNAATAKVKCEIDGVEVPYVPSYLAERHGMSVADYLAKYPDAPLESEEVSRRYAESIKGLRREPPPPPESLTVEIGGMKVPVNPDVPEDACLPMPVHYRFPEHGDLADDARRSLRYWLCGRSQWIWGPTGSGKDALPSALCAWSRTPSALFPVNPDLDIMSWFYDKAFSAGRTEWIFGELFKALVHGYVSPISGRRIPMTIVLSDFDRAGSAQAEALRLVGDSIQGRVKGPLGETYPVLPGTRLIVTANTMGGGDPTGKMVSANIIDKSIINRVERKVRFHLLDWRDEEPVVRAKFPFFCERYGHMLKAIGDCTAALRVAAESETLYGDFSHRDLCTWIQDCEDMIKIHEQYGSGALPKDILKQGFNSYADGLADIENRMVALQLVDPHLKGGALPRGNPSGVRKEPLKL